MHTYTGTEDFTDYVGLTQVRPNSDGFHKCLVYKFLPGENPDISIVPDWEFVRFW